MSTNDPRAILLIDTGRLPDMQAVLTKVYQLAEELCELAESIPAEAPHCPTCQCPKHQ